MFHLKRFSSTKGNRFSKIAVAKADRILAQSPQRVPFLALECLYLRRDLAHMHGAPLDKVTSLLTSLDAQQASLVASSSSSASRSRGDPSAVRACLLLLRAVTLKAQHRGDEARQLLTELVALTTQVQLVRYCAVLFVCFFVGLFGLFGLFVWFACLFGVFICCVFVFFLRMFHSSILLIMF